jgi:glutamine synthetase
LADELEKLKKGDFDGLTSILSKIVQANKQVLFEGNGYSEEWHAEAARRGLPNNRTTVDALPSLTTDKAKKLFSGYGVLSERELEARVEIYWERYVKVGNIEANCALDIASTMIVPAAARYLGELAKAPSSRGINAVCEQVSGLADQLVDAIDGLEHAQHDAHEAGSVQEEATAFASSVIPAQERLREVVDELETMVADDLWPLPKYRELLFQY